MASNLRVDSIVPTTSGNVSIGTATGGVTIPGNLGIAGVLTYEDVTNVDSVGVVTARAGIHIDDSIVHIGDTNTKIRFPAADTISFETAGSERLRIASTGYVQTKSELWVGGSAPVLRWRDTTHGEKATARISGSDLYFEVANNERFRIASNGQITTRGASGTSFNNAGAGDFGSFLTVNGGHTANQWGILSLEGNTSANGYAVGAIQFINQNNANGSSGANTQSRLLAKIDVQSVTSDSNAGDDSGGDLVAAQAYHNALSNQTRGIIAGGGNPYVNTIQYVTMASLGDAQDFNADLHTPKGYMFAMSSSTRGIVGGGVYCCPGVSYNTLEYVTIQTTGTISDFGDISTTRYEGGVATSATRGVLMAGYGPGYTNICLLYTSPSPRDGLLSRMPSSA